MELRQLRYFKEVVDLMNFTEAAKKLFISQSTLSQQIMQLENELDVQLFLRNGRHISLTEEGRLLYPYARECIQKSQEAITLLGEVKHLNAGEIRIGITFGLRQIIASAIIAFRKAYPHIKIIVHFGSSDEMIAKLNSNEVDVLITFDMELDERVYELKPLFVSAVCLIVPAGAPVAAKQEIQMNELSQYELIAQHTGFNTWSFVNKAVQKKGVALHVIMEVNDNPTLIELVKSGIGYGIMADVTIRNEPALVGIPIAGRHMKRNVWGITIKSGYQSKKLEAFYRIMIQEVTR